MTVENKDEINNKSKHLNDSLKRLMQELGEITNDIVKSNDEITLVFYKDLVDSVDYTNFEVIPKLLEKIDGIIDNPNLGIDNNTLEQLKNIKGLLQERYNEIIDEFRIPSETTPDKAEEKDSIVSVDFLRSLSLDDIKTLFVDGNFREIKKDLIRKENGNEYVIIKGQRFNLGEGTYNHQTDNIIFIDKNSRWKSFYLGNAYCSYTFNERFNTISIVSGNIEEIRFGNGQSLVRLKNTDGEIWSSSEIDVRCSNIDNGVYHLYGGDNSVLDLHFYTAPESFIKIASILSKMKESGLQCQKSEENIVKIGDTTYEFNGEENIDNILEWINNYKFDN